MNTETSDFLSVLRFLHYLRKYFLILIFSAGLISYLIYSYVESKRKYPASARFIVTDLPGTNIPETVGTDADLRSLRSNAMQLFFSSEVIDALIGKFDLYMCYRVNRNAHFARERLVNKIRASIQFKLDKIGGHELIVTTYDRNLSAAIANALIDETDKLNGKLLNEELMRKADMMDNLIHLSHQNAGQNNLNLTKNIESLSQLTKSLEPQKAKSSEQEDLESRLFSVLALLQQNLESMTRTRDYYDVILKSYQSGSFHFFYVVAKAIPDFKNYIGRNIAIGLTLGIIIALLSTMVIYYIRRQLEKIHALGLYPGKPFSRVPAQTKVEPVNSKS